MSQQVMSKLHGMRPKTYAVTLVVILLALMKSCIILTTLRYQQMHTGLHCTTDPGSGSHMAMVTVIMMQCS